MAHILRVIFLALALLVSSFSAHSLSPQYQYKTDYTGWMSSASAACNASKASFFFDPGEWTFVGVVDGQCRFSGSAAIGGGTSYLNVHEGGDAVCPSNSSLSGNECACSSGYEEKDGQCRPKNPCPEGQHEEGGACVPDNCKPDEVRVNGLCVKEPECPAGQTRVNGVCKENGCEKGKNLGLYELGTTGATLYLCENKCQVRVAAQFDITYTDADGKQITEYSGSGIQTGASCSGGGGGGGPSTSGPGGGGGPSDGGGGTGGGTGGGGNNNGGSGGGTGGGGSGGGGTGGGGTGGSGNNNNGGSSSGSSLPGVKPPEPVDKDENGGCPQGTVLSAGACWNSAPKAPDADGKCSDGYMKVDKLCVPLVPSGEGGNGNGDGDGDGSGFGGSCAAGFACEGDAIQCAIAREQHIRNCKLFEDPSDESRLYDAEKAKDPNRKVTSDLPGNDTVDMTGRIDMSDALGGGGCISDLYISVLGQSISLPISVICPYLAMLGNVLVAVSLLLAVRIVGRG